MEKKIFFWVLSLTLVALALALVLPGGRAPDPNPKLPWDIKVDGTGVSEVFGLKLGSSTLQEARDILQDSGKVSLFVTKAGKPELEAYFERIFLSGLRADFVLVLEGDEETLQQIYDRGRRISRTTEVTRKVEIATEDQFLVATFPIKLINYIPQANLEAELLSSRFGEPLQKIPEAETGVVHWVYPEMGLSIGLNPDGKEVFQYAPPKEIDKLIQRLNESAKDERVVN
ncbi:MAG: hypothetical protein JMN24_03395 [gamma proteobacterium endosymbiont of Lamellibrachia anaximandri]|nr:hypothetical protein [gamma proteobacterium endosymbiont of Lamellibrachia anaximandri]MBL3617293.1 hypothetical protein [gamma proteobacterium endosymbiont of Lamellibrachia anaximandri]